LKNGVKHIIVTMLIAVILFSTMGVSVNSLYCFCTGESQVSLFEINHVCDKKPSESAECLALPEGFSDLHPCCQKAIIEANAKKAHDNHDCTKKTKKRLKADLKFLEIKKTELPTLELFADASDFSFPKVISEKKDLAHLHSETLPRPPPPQYWGRKWLNFIQVYRC
jgi:hypothetical protein